jgi:hypothetical protein
MIERTKHDDFLDKLSDLSDVIESYSDLISDRITNVTNKIQKVINIAADKWKLFLKEISDLIMGFYPIARLITFPMHWIWIAVWNYFSETPEARELLNKEGTHYITALAGGGKSTLAWQKMYDYGKMTGKCSYVTTEMEKVKYDEMGKPFVRHIHFRPSDFYGLEISEKFDENGKPIKEFKQGVQKKRFNKDLATCLVFDEMHYLNNNRLNGTKENKQSFIPMINSFVLQRHAGMKWILVLSQMPKNDTQIMNILTGYHRIQIKKGFSYSKWLEDGLFRKVIKGWKIHSFEVKVENDYLKLVTTKKWFKTATVDFSDFETLNMKTSLEHLPVDQRKVLQ